MQRIFSQAGCVFWITAALSAALVACGVFFTSGFAAVTTAAFGWITANLSWFYMIVTTLFLGFCVVNISFVVLAFLAVYFFVFGPTVTELNAFTQGMGNYLGNLVPTSLRVNAFNQDTTFLGQWTAFYWAWWVTWAPYVGVFAARISRGRTIREFVAGMLIAPTLICAV